jgi:hypothetical protein
MKNNKIKTVMHEWKKGDLHSGSKKGPEVKDKDQAIAIAINEQKKSKAHVPKKKTK